MKTKRILSIAITLAVLLGLLPGMSLTASAEGNTTTITPTSTSGTMTITLTIAAASVKTAPKANTLTYNGAAQTLTTTGEAEAGTMQYQLGENATTEPTGTWGTTVPQGTEAKDYYVWYRSRVNDNNISKANCVTVTISPASIATATVTLSATSLTWSGSEQSVTVSSVKLGETTTLTADTDYEVTSGTTGTAVNTYTVNVTGKGNYTGTATATWNIVAKNMTASAENVTVSYDGQPHGIAVNVTDPASGASIKYGSTEGTYDQDESPTITNVADSPLTVYYKVTATNYNDKTGSATVTINKADQTAPAAPTAASTTVNSITLTAIDNGEYKCGTGNWQDSTTFTDLAMNTEYTFYQRLKGDDNHNASPDSQAANISTSNHAHEWSYQAEGATITATCADSDSGHGEPKTATLTINAPARTTYGGSESAEATIEGSIDGVENPVIVYKKGTETLDSAPVNAGTYTASITLGEATASVEYTIAAAATTITENPAASEITYGQTLADSTLTGGTASMEGTFAWKDSSITPAVSDSQNSEYDVVFTPTDANYGTAECKIKLTVNKADSAVTKAPEAKTLTYNGQAQALVTEGTAAGGEMQYALGTASKATQPYTTSIPTATNAGTYYVWYKAVGDANHNDSTPKCITSRIRAAISHKVTFKVANGSWNDGTSAAKTVTLSGYEGDTLKLAASQIPAAGNRPAAGYKAGSWDKTPSAETAITGDVTYSYSYARAASSGTKATGEAETEQKTNNAARILNLKARQSGSKVTLSWNRISDASMYKIYGAYRGKQKKLLKTIKGNATTKATITKLNGKKLNLKKQYKFQILAYKKVNGKTKKIAKSLSVYLAGRKHKKYTNVKEVKVTKKTYSLKKGKTAKISAKITKVKKKKKLVNDRQVSRLRYVSSNKAVATVSRSGLIKAVKTGKCSIYVYAINGVNQKITVVVK